MGNIEHQPRFGKKPNVNKLLLSWLLFVSSFELMAIIQQRSGEYHVSIFRQLPDFLLLFGIFVTLTSVMLSLWLLSQRMQIAAFLALLPVIVQVMFVIVLPYLLGYQIPVGDALTHAGDIRTIQLDNHITSAPRALFPNQYRPMFHLLVITLDEVTQELLVFHQTFLIFPILDVLQSSLFILFIGIICRRCGMSAVYSVFGSLLVIFTGVLPANFAFETLFIIGLYVFTRLVRPGNTKRFGLLFIIFSGALWPYHQLTPLVLVLISAFALFMHLAIVRNMFSAIGLAPLRKLTVSFALVPVSIGLMGYLWWTYAPYFEMGIHMIFTSGRSTTLSATAQASTLFDKFGFTLVDFILLVVKQYGSLLILLGFSGLGVILALIPQNRVKTPRVPAVLLFAVGISIIWTPIEFIGGDFIAGWGRALMTARLLSPIFMGVFMFKYLGRMREYQKRKYTIFLMIFLLLSGGLSIGLLLHQGALHNSPWVASSNNYVTESEIEGWEWYFSSKSGERGTITLGRRPAIFENFLLTVGERQQRHDNIMYQDSRTTMTVPPHFGGDVPLGKQYSDAYYMETAAIRLNRLKVHPEWGIFTPNDFKQLSVDSTVNHIYQNGNMDIHVIINASNSS